MIKYPFNLISPTGEKRQENKKLLKKRTEISYIRSFERDAPYFIAGQELADAINTSIAVGDPILLTGEPGTGKTQAAYFAAWQLDVKCIHFQVKSDTTAQDLLYEFDMVRYFRDAHYSNTILQNESINKNNYIEKRALWDVIDLSIKDNCPQILLIDEIDKAPRDFPNDLLHELDQMEFTIKETGQKIEAPENLRPIIFITSNSERRLPEPFLRRCVYHHIEFDDQIVQKAVLNRRNEFTELSDDFLELAIKRFLSLREEVTRKPPATGELLVWLKVLSIATGKNPEQINKDLSKLPYVGVLLKDHQDIEELRSAKC